MVFILMGAASRTQACVHAVHGKMFAIREEILAADKRQSFIITEQERQRRAELLVKSSFLCRWLVDNHKLRRHTVYSKHLNCREGLCIVL